MDMVVDASALLAVLINEKEKAGIVAATAGASLVTPACIEYELGNAASALFKRGLMAVSDGVLLWHAFCKIPLRQVVPPIASALAIAGSEGLYAYDAYYLALAEQLRLPLLSLDRRMLTVAEKRGIECVEVDHARNDLL